MSKLRQTAEACPPQRHPVAALSHEFADDQEIPPHFHAEDQFVYACRGVMTVHTEEGTWVVPPQRAVWIPAQTPHRISISAPVSMRTLYLKPGMVRRLPQRCQVLNVPTLLKELVLHACRSPYLSRRNQTQRHLIDFIIDQLEVVQASPLELLSPTDTRAARVAQALSNNPGDARSLEELCASAGASKRTVERLFRVETHMSLGDWRRQLRLMHALRLLAVGHKITRVALDSGYSTPSAFVAMFRKVLGTTPGKYFENGNVAGRSTLLLAATQSRSNSRGIRAS